MDLHSGKLHKEFHETLDQKLIDLAKFQAANPEDPEFHEAHKEDGQAKVCLCF